MYLHLGQNTIVHESEILGIFDLDITSQSYRTRQYESISVVAESSTFISRDWNGSFTLRLSIWTNWVISAGRN